MDKEKPKYKPEHILMDAIGFTEEDLDANQKGELSDRQVAMLRHKHNISLFSVILELICIAALVGIYIFTFEFAESCLVVCTLIPLVIFTLVTSFHYPSIYHDFRDCAVIWVEGRIRLNIRNNLFTLKIGERTLALPKATFLAFKNGEPYVIYYTPRTKTILSAEWLSQQEHP